ncbi:hypothetical protein GCM10027578_21410 [Spirosoma luteolum]
MIKRFTSLILTLLITAPLTLPAQPLPSDEQLAQLLVSPGRTPAETAVTVGKNLLGAPYVAHTLDQSATEQLVVNLQAFDCTTYLETILALALTWHETADKATAGRPATPAGLAQPFKSYLTRLRYRDGRIDGYASRLHYFSAWLRDNERKGLLTDITGTLPGRMTVTKPVTYMTSAVHKYPHLADPTVFRQVAQTEASLATQPFAFVPARQVRQAEAALREGDIIMLTAARPGLDMKHVGLAVRQPDGRMHLLHASSDAGQVVISTLPLSDYVLAHPRLSGIRVARLRGSGLLTADGSPR